MLPPGGEGEVKVTLTPKGNHEDIVKRIHVVSDDPKQPRFALTMKGKLLVDVRAQPASLALPGVSPGAAATLEFGLTITDPSTTKLVSIAVEDKDNFELRELEPAADGQLRYELRFRGSKKVGNFGSRVEVRTDGPNTPELNVPIRASVVSNLRYAKRVHFNERDGSFTARELRISTRDGVPVKIKKIEDPGGLLSFETLEPVGGTVTIIAKVDAEKAAGLSEEQRVEPRTLTIQTNDPDEPRVEIIYSLATPRIRGRVNR